MPKMCDRKINWINVYHKECFEKVAPLLREKTDPQDAEKVLKRFEEWTSPI
jgi:hypothetical protein